MKNRKPLIIVLGEPNSVFIEILSKVFKKKSIKSIINYPIIIIGSKEKLSKVKSYQIEEGVECLLCPFSSIEELPSLLDSKIAELQSEVISIIPAGAFPKKLARKQLLHFSKSKYQFWGWYHFGNKFNFS